MIYIATHKRIDVPRVKGYAPLQVGAALREDFGYVKDNTGDNISEKNKNYCELTGLYWLWKNTSDDYVGLIHYRRYFCCSLSSKKMMSERFVKGRLKKFDIIVPRTYPLYASVEDQYLECGFKKDLDITGDVIKELYPEYYSDYVNVLKGTKIYFCNMFVAGRKVFDGYCKWLFDILFTLERRVDITGYTDFQQRIYGFISERLLAVYIIHNKLKAREVHLIKKGDKTKFPHSIKVAVKRKAYNIAKG